MAVEGWLPDKLGFRSFHRNRNSNATLNPKTVANFSTAGGNTIILDIPKIFCIWIFKSCLNA